MLFPDPEKYPRWAAPLIGGVVGCMVGLHTGKWPVVAIGTGCGIAAACLLLFLEGAKSGDQEPTWIGNFFAILAVPSVIVLPLAVPICLIAFGLNRRVAGWANDASRWGVAICVVVAIGLGGIFLFL
jgi:hypothetical protein